MLIALLVVAILSFFSGDARVLDDIADRVEKTVTDEDRSRQARAVLEELKGEMTVGADQQKARLAELTKLHRRHGATLEDYQRIFDAREADLTTRENQLLAARSRLKTSITRDEWSEVFTNEASK